jgi:hypothetical protein
MVEFNRNQWIMLGIVLLLLGLELRYVKAFVLNERTTQFVAQRLQEVELAATDAATSLAAAAPIAKKRIEPPRWLGLALLSAGAVMTVHGLALKKQA